MPSENVDAACERMIAKSPGEVREWAEKSRQKGIVTADYYEQAAAELYLGGAIKVWVGEVEECDEQVWMIHCMVVELPQDIEAMGKVIAKYQEFAQKLQTDAPLRFAGERYIQFWCGE